MKNSHNSWKKTLKSTSKYVSTGISWQTQVHPCRRCRYLLRSTQRSELTRRVDFQNQVQRAPKRTWGPSWQQNQKSVYINLLSPPFPKKKIFGITNDSPENIEKRREELEKYFNEIFNSKEVLRSDALKYFIEESRKQAQRDRELEALNRKKKWVILFDSVE